MPYAYIISFVILMPIKTVTSSRVYPPPLKIMSTRNCKTTATPPPPSGEPRSLEVYVRGVENMVEKKKNTVCTLTRTVSRAGLGLW
jgi:hypothetical protein